MIKYKIGVDEAGRGSWLGPVVACSFCFNPKILLKKNFIKRIGDSKKISEKKREILFDKLVEYSLGNNPKVFFGIGVVDNFLIDEINIKEANREAMRRSLIELLRKIDFDDSGKYNEKIDIVLIDGKDNYEFEELKQKPVYIIKGDGKVVEIGAASIIAKVFRDKLIKTYSELYPNFSLEKHKGYGTKKHSEYLEKKDKITGIHRLSYKPIKKILNQKSKLLLHICCGPDAIIPIMDLKEKFDITCFWYDPNIQPKKEYNKRLKYFKKICNLEKIPFIEGVYDTDNFLKKIKGFENELEKGKRCTICYDIRLTKTAILAKKLGIKNWTSSLSTSPHKDLNKLFKIGAKLDKKYALKKVPLECVLNFLAIDFKKNAGFKRSLEYCKINKIYRQNYCGCIFSKK